MSQDIVSETNACPVFWTAPKTCLSKTLPAKKNGNRPTNNNEDADDPTPSPISNEDDIECSLGIYEWIVKVEQDIEFALEVDQDKSWWSDVRTVIIAAGVAKKEQWQSGGEEQATWKRAKAEPQHQVAIE